MYKNGKERTSIQGENSVLVYEENGEQTSLRIVTMSENTIPEMLNGESGFHIFHVRMLTGLILKQLSETEGFDISDQDIENISIASSLHDIGKSQIPKSILDFPGKLSPLQYDIV